MLLMFPLIAHAEPPTPSEATVEVVEDGKRFRVKRVTEIELEGVGLEGELVGPDGILVPFPKPPKFNPLIQLRRDWNDELLWSVDEIQ